MELFEAIEKRHSYRGPFENQPVPREDLQRIVQAGIQAPSGKNAQTTSFVIIDDLELIQKIQALHPTNKAMQQAKAYIACFIDKHPDAIYEGHSFQVEDYAAAVENMLLAITALGYAAVWVDGWLRLENRAEIIGNYVGAPRNKIIRVILPIGVPAEEHKQNQKKPFSERAWFNRYGAS
ncbi:MAG: nitroreductase family protein [Candidatus Omnitrophica bacterium]|nr:nitroreductase family protein [Candidatus Omnitrophota bacterium]